VDDLSPTSGVVPWGDTPRTPTCSRTIEECTDGAEQWNVGDRDWNAGDREWNAEAWAWNAEDESYWKE
jgi:hypothetical protein